MEISSSMISALPDKDLPLAAPQMKNTPAELRIETVLVSRQVVLRIYRGTTAT